MLEKSTTVRLRSIAIFTVLAIGLGWIFCDIRTRLQWGFPLEMWSPAIAAALTYVIVERHSLLSVGVRAHILGKVGLWWISWIPMGLLGISYMITALRDPRLVLTSTEIAKSLKGSMGPLPIQIVTLLLLNLVIAPFLNTVLVYLGEEIGWRGFLYPRLYAKYGVLGLILAGIIWGLWHAPMMAFTGLNYPNIPWWLGGPYFTLFTIPAGIVIFFIYRRTGSIIAAGLAHGAIDMCSPTISFFMHTNQFNSLIDGAGIISMAVFWIAAIVIVRNPRWLIENTPGNDKTRRLQAHTIVAPK